MSDESRKAAAYKMNEIYEQVGEVDFVNFFLAIMSDHGTRVKMTLSWPANEAAAREARAAKKKARKGTKAA